MPNAPSRSPTLALHRLQTCLFVEILDRYLYFFERDMGKVTPQNISALLGLIEDHVKQIGDPEVGLLLPLQIDQEAHQDETTKRGTRKVR